MAFATGVKTDTIDSNIKRYIGIGEANIIAVNPTRQEFNSIFHSNKPDPINYTGVRNIDGTDVKTARISFILNLSKTWNKGIETIIPINFNLEYRNRFNRDKTKIQVIDCFGRTGWVTQEELKTHAIPVTANGPLRLNPNYRPTYVGEENIVKFIKAFLCIPDVDEWDQTLKKFVQRKDTDNSLIYLEKVPKYFEGDFEEIVSAINTQKDNRVKVLFGVRTTQDNKEYQDFFANAFMTARAKSTNRLNRELENVKNNGGYPNTLFDLCDIRVYEGPQVTPLEQTLLNDPFTAAPAAADDDLPFGF